MPKTKPTILIADDTSANIELLYAVLGSEYEILFATSGAKAVEIAVAETPDLILLDVIMPEMDGFETCIRLKSDHRTALIPVIFVTSLNQEAEEARGLEVGAIDFIAKPFSSAVIKARVRNHLELKMQRDLLRDLSFLDGLTGLANRRRFDQFLDQEWRRSLRSRSPLSLILMDIDYFKAYNDAAGHLAGDDCLRRIAQTLAASAQRRGDLIARYGGEEFVCVLPDTDAAGALAISEQIQSLIADLALPHPRSEIAPLVTLSLGTTTQHAVLGKDFTSLIQAADLAMYRAKEQGRNQIVVWTEEIEAASEAKTLHRMP
jgi:diguanylate cyclase (GGDEF)-like protein